MAFQLFKFGFGPKSVLGVDIGTATIKIVELASQHGRKILKNYGIINIPSAPITKHIADDALVAGLKELVKKANFSSKDCVASIPSFNTFSTVIEMPYLSEKDLAKAIPFEAKKYIPLPLQEVILDWTILSIKEDRLSKGQMLSQPYPTVEVLIVAVPKDAVERYKIIFSRSNLKLRALELENTAIIRALIGNDQSPIGVINIGGRSTNIFVVNKGAVRLSRNYEVGGFELTQVLARALNISLSRAETMKKQLGIKGKDGKMILDTLGSQLEMLITEAARTIKTYEDKSGARVIKLTLTGGLASMPGLKEYFQSKLQPNLTIGDPFSRILYPQNLALILKELTPTLSVAVGLAMREI